MGYVGTGKRVVVLVRRGVGSVTAKSSYPARPARLRDADLTTRALPKAEEEIGPTGERVELLAALPGGGDADHRLREIRRGGAAVGTDMAWPEVQTEESIGRRGLAECALATAPIGAVSLVDITARDSGDSSEPLDGMRLALREPGLAGRQPSAHRAAIPSAAPRLAGGGPPPSRAWRR
jgi:hypothetical protein